ncbi:MAG: redoxin domain-containing protein [Gemmatimonadaceae bacterium]
MTARQQLGTVIAVLALIAIGVFAGMRMLGDEISPLGLGTPAPEIHASTVTPPTVTRTLADYKGHPVLLNIWATWCAPCRAEMPSIERVYQTYGPKGLKVVSVSIDDAGTEAGIRAFAHDMGLTFEILHDSTGQVQRAYQTTGVPETVIIGRDGVIRKKIAMATDWDSEPNRRLIERLLAE